VTTMYSDQTDTSRNNVIKQSEEKFERKSVQSKINKLSCGYTAAKFRNTVIQFCSDQLNGLMRNIGKLNIYSVVQNCTIFCMPCMSSNIDRFVNVFHCQNQENICNSTITKHSITPQMCRYSTLWNVSVLKQQLKTRLL